jgi:hypothetical protein
MNQSNAAPLLTILIWSFLFLSLWFTLALLTDTGPAVWLSEDTTYTLQDMRFFLAAASAVCGVVCLLLKEASKGAQ